ncbi:MAG: gfo/Idh/MocA family oxidoreductase [Planctomycetia bacterium]|nr:gfo/Idh/MocA family oxidoreductase [Planctomycetia bacterium]
MPRVFRSGRTSRREFFGTAAGGIAGAAALAGAPLPRVHAAGSDEIRVAVVGCGGRGGGAAVDALSVPGGETRVVALADVFADRPQIVKRSLAEQFSDRLDVPDERIFVGFEAYKQALDCLRTGDIALFATPPAFRAPMFAYAIEKGVHVFMEKPISVDGPSTRRMLELARRADEKGVKVAVGLMCRHCDRRRELFQRLRDGEAGELIAYRGYRHQDPTHNLDLAPGRGEADELLWQVKRFHNFLWASGGIFSDYCVHHIDEVSWMHGSWPVKAEGSGGRHYRGRIDDQNFDNYAVEYTFADGAKFFYSSRVMKGCDKKFGVFGHGSKGAFTISGSGHSPAKSTIYQGQRTEKEGIVWAAEQPEPNPYRREWEHFVAAIIAGDAYNEAVRGAEASLATAMGRYAAHTGRAITFDDYLNSPDDLTAGVDALVDGSPSILVAGPDGTYPVPNPGRYKFEYRNAVTPEQS